MKRYKIAVIITSLIILGILVGMDTFSVRSRMVVSAVNLATSGSEKRVCTDPQGNKGYVVANGNIAYVDVGGEVLSCFYKTADGVTIKIVGSDGKMTKNVPLSPSANLETYTNFVSIMTGYPFTCRVNSSEVDSVMRLCNK